MDYCVAIRTLGTAGEKYQILLDSLNRQTIRPKKILVFIPHGYELPKETIGWEEYVRCPKGMITQRSLPFDEIDTEYILFCDDDISLEPTSVERLYRGLIEKNGDCVSPNTFPVELQSFAGKIKKAISGYAFPRKDDGWAFKILRNSSYTYNSNPQMAVLPTESAAGPCMLIKKQAYKAIHFEDERWMEQFGYTLGDDLLFYYKLHTMGFKVFVHFQSGVVHLDAGTSSRNLPPQWIRKSAELSLIIPYRIRYKRANITCWERIKIANSCCVKFLEQMLFISIRNLIKQRKIVLCDYIRGLRDGWIFVHSSSYKKVPMFDAYCFSE